MYRAIFYFRAKRLRVVRFKARDNDSAELHALHLAARLHCDDGWSIYRS